MSCHWDIVRRAESASGASRHTGKAGSGHVRTSRPGALAIVPPGGREPIETLDCLSCHAPHPNGQPHQLLLAADFRDAEPSTLDPVSQACIRCHGAFLQTGRQGNDYTLHPVGVEARVRADADGPPLPLENGRVACTTCHFVHGSPNPDLLRWGDEERIAACTSCHAAGDTRASSPILVTSDRSPR